MVLLRCTVADAGAVHDVELSVEPETSVASLLAALPADVGGRPVHVGSVLLDPNGTFGGSAVTVGCVISVGVPGPDPREIPPNAAGVLRVMEGPDIGRWSWVLTGGRVLIGRGEDADLVVNDPEVSKQHAEIVFGDAATPTATLRDLGSINGTTVAGVGFDDAVQLPDGAAIQVGGSVIQWRPVERVDREWLRAPDGRIEFTRRFHRARVPEPGVVEMPAALPETSRGVLALVISLGGPIVLGLVVFVATGNAAFLLIMLLSPLAAGVQQLAERRSSRRRGARFSEEQARASTQIVEAVTTEEELRRRTDPDEMTLILCALGALPGLWTKQQGGHDALTLRVGIRDEPASVQLRGDRWPGLDKPRLRAVPVTIDLRETGVLGVRGDPARVQALTRWLIVQLATRRSPRDLQLVLLSRDGRTDHSWARWLPHLDCGDGAAASPCRIGTTLETRAARVEELRQLVEDRTRARRGAGGPGSDEADVVVVLDGGLERHLLVSLRTILIRGPAVGVQAICLDEMVIDECGGRVLIEADGGLELIRQLGDPPIRAMVESTGRPTAEWVARLLAPLRDRAASPAEKAIPFPVRYLDLVEMQNPTPDTVLRCWAEHPGSRSGRVLPGPG